MNNRIIILVVGSLAIITVIIIALYINISPKSRPVLVAKNSEVVSYRAISENEVLYTTQSNKIVLAKASGNKTITPESGAKNIQLSPTGKYYSTQLENVIRLYNTGSNTAIQSFSAQQFIWQKNDSFIFSKPIPKTANPIQANDGHDFTQEIYFSNTVGETPKLIANKESLGQIQYDVNSKLFTYLAPDEKTNPLQIGIITQLSQSNSKQIATVSESLFFYYLNGTVLTDKIVGSYFFDGSVATKLVSFSPGDTIGSFNDQVVILKITQSDKIYKLLITSVESGKKITDINLNIDTKITGENISIPYIINGFLLFRADNGIFSYKL